MRKERPEKRPEAPETPTGLGWAYGGTRAYYRAMEDWGDKMTYWHRDAREKGILCYENCPDCRDDIQYDRGDTDRAARSLAQTEAGKAWLRKEVQKRLG